MRVVSATLNLTILLWGLPGDKVLAAGVQDHVVELTEKGQIMNSHHSDSANKDESGN